MKTNPYSNFFRKHGKVERIKFLLILAMISIFGQAHAQSNYQVGNGTGTNAYLPLYSFYGYTYSQTIYLASELTAQGATAGFISKIKYYYATAGNTGVSDDTWVVYIGNTTQGSFTGTTNWTSVSNLSQVYSGSVTFPSAAGNWMEITLDTPFFWDGTSNLVVGVDQNEAGYDSPYPYFGYTSTTDLRSIEYYSDATNPDPASPPTANYSSYGIANIQFVITPQSTNDCGISALTSPTSPSCAGTYPVTATLQNYGSASLTSANISWSINGAAQTGTSFSGNLSNIQGSNSSTSISLGNITLGAAPVDLKIWSSSPNATTDGVAFNDTISVTLSSSLSGTYTIGSNGDFANFTAATDALMNYGVCGATVFHVQDSVFNEQITLNNIPGSSSTNTILFTTSPSASNMATLQFSSNSSSALHTWKFNGNQYVTIDSINIYALGGSYARAIEFSGNNDYITVKNCNLVVPVVSTSSSYYAVIYNNSGTNMVNNSVFENNTMIGGGYAVYWYGGSSASLEQDNSFINNSITDFYYYGLLCYYQNNLIVDNNYIENSGTSTLSYISYRYYVDGASHFRGNTLINNSGGYLVYSYYNDATAGSPAIIANNFFSSLNSSYTSTNYGFYNYYTSNQKFYHNNFYHTGSSASYQAVRLYFSSSSYSGNEFKNNIIQADGNAQPIYFYSPSSAYLTSDNNAYYYPNTTIGYFNTAYNDLATMQAGQSTDANSIVTDPIYSNTSIGDLHIGSIALDGAAVNVGITVDIDGQTRPTSTDIGADERVFPLNDVAPSNLLSPSNPFCGDSAQIELVILNTGQLNLTSASIHYTLNGTAGTTYSWTGNLSANTADTVVIATSAFSAGAELIVWTSSPNNLLDSNTVFDTISISIFEGLSGSYNIPGDFASITNAVDTLNLVGTCDTVWFNIAAGTYDQAVTISQFQRNMADAPVIFRSSTNDSADVIWATTSSNAVITLQGADYIWFEDLTIKNSNSSGVNAIALNGGASYNKFSRSHIIGVPTTTTSVTYATIYDSPGRDDYNSYIDNMIENGSVGMYLYGVGTTDLEEGTMLDGNIIRNFYYMGCYNYYQFEMIERNNEVYSNTSYTSAYGMYHYYANGYMEFTGNHIHYVEGGNGFYMGAYFSSCTGANLMNRGDFSNNIIIGGKPGQTATNYGMYLTTASMKNFHNNTFVMLDGSTTSSAMTIYTGDGNEYVNNIFAVLPTDTSATYALGKGYSLYYSSGILINSDHNDFYSAGNAPIYYLGVYNDLASYQAATMNDMNSYDVNPDFVDTINAILCNADLDGAAMVNYVTTDFAGNSRNPNTPDIGAREYQSVSNFSIGPDTTICDIQTTLYVGAGAISISWQDANSNNLGTSTSIQVNENTSFPVSVSYTNLCGSASDDITLGFVSNVSLDSALHLCANQTETLTPDGNGNPNASYNWFPTGASTAQINVNAPGIYTISKSQEGCNSSASIYVTQSEGVTLADAEICAANLPFSVDATITDGVSYNWSGGSSMTTALNDFSATGSYSITTTDAFGCAGSDTFDLLVIDTPIAAISNDSHSSNLFYLSSLLSQNVGTNASYFWTFGDGTTSTDANPSHLFPWNGTAQTFTVTLTITNDCGTSTSVTTDITSDPLGVNGIKNASTLLVYPNPTNGLATISGNFTSSNINLEVIDVSGRIVKSIDNASFANNQFELDLQDLAKGSYQIKMVNGANAQIAKVILQ